MRKNNWRMKNKNIAYRGVILFTTGGKAPYAELSRNFSHPFFFVPDFWETKRLWAKLCTLFGWFPAWHFAHCAGEFAKNKKLSWFLGETSHEPKFHVKHRSFDDKKNWANNTSNRMVRGGSNVWAFGDEAVGQTGGQTHLLGRHASTLFDLDFGFFVFFSAFWDVMGNPMNGTEKKRKNR